MLLQTYDETQSSYEYSDRTNHFTDGELWTLCHTVAIDRNGRTAVEIQAVTIAAELISKQVHTATL